MTSRATRRFWKLYEELPEPIRRLAVKNYLVWRQTPFHPSLDFKKLQGKGNRFSVRVGDHYRVLGRQIEGGVEWIWVGTHEEYNKLVSR